ncbi:MAG: Ig-like domain-containing protein [Thermoanaerobaculia bacterium]
MNKKDRSLLAGLSLLGWALAASPGRAQTTTTTLAAETANTTSACSSDSNHAYCNGPFNGMTDTGVTPNVKFNPAPGNVSPVRVRRLLYPGSTTRLFAALMPWFEICDPGPYPHLKNSGAGCDHVQIGYNSNDAAMVDAQISDMLRRGFEGISIAWYNEPTRPEYDGTTLRVRDNLDARCSGLSECSMSFILRLNEGVFTYGCGDKTSTSLGQPACVLQKIKDALAYADTNYFGHASYLKDGGRPAVSFFFTESNYFNQCAGTSCSLAGTTCNSSSTCWTAIWNNVNTYVQSLSNGDPKLIFRNASRFSASYSDGEYAWVDTSSMNNGDPYALAYLDNFYSTALAHPTKVASGAGWKGFYGLSTYQTWNDTKTSQRCGQTWLDSVKRANSKYSSTTQLPYLLISTWNDYEEGTEIETGIDNCYTINASLSSSTLTWTPASTDSNATESTIDHYEIFDSADGQHLSSVGSFPSGMHAIAASSLPLGCGARRLFVKAVGAPSILDKMSVEATYTSPSSCTGVTISAPVDGATVISPFTVTASEGTSKVPDSMLVYLDGNSIYKGYGVESLSLSVDAAPGTHTVLVKAYYSDGTSAVSQVGVDVSSAPDVTISSPVSGATYNSPVRVIATETTGRNADFLEIRLDGSLVSTVPDSDTADVSIDAAAGSHTVSVKAIYNDGTASSSSRSFTVRNGTVTITSPADGAIVTSPVHIVANESSSLAATAMKAYLDGASVSSTGTESIDTSITASSGTHQLTVKAWYADGTVTERRIFFTVP